MIFWVIATVALMLANLAYCVVKVRSDFRGPTPATGVWGVFAVLGAVSVIAMAVVGFLVAGSGI